MSTLKQFRAMHKKGYTEHPGFSNIDVRAHFDCPCCGTNMLLLWHFYPDLYARYGRGGFHFHSVEFYRTPDGEVVKARGEE